MEKVGKNYSSDSITDDRVVDDDSCSSKARPALGGTSLVEGAEVVLQSSTGLLAEAGTGGNRARGGGERCS